jgi:hypothetical protein
VCEVVCVCLGEREREREREKERKRDFYINLIGLLTLGKNTLASCPWRRQDESWSMLSLRRDLRSGTWQWTDTGWERMFTLYFNLTQTDRSHSKLPFIHTCVSVKLLYKLIILRITLACISVSELPIIYPFTYENFTPEFVQVKDNSARGGRERIEKMKEMYTRVGNFLKTSGKSSST